jgi:hypothetical protein
MFSTSFLRRVATDRPIRLDALILFTKWGHCKVRPSELKRIVLEQEAEARKCKGKV